MKNKILIFGIVLLLFSGIVPNVPGYPYVDTEDLDDSICYGFIIKVDAQQSYELQSNISILVNKLLSENITVYWICENISVMANSMTENDESYSHFFEKGCFVIPFTDDLYNDALSSTMLYRYNSSKNIGIYLLNEQLTDITVHILVEPKLAYVERLVIEPFNYYQCLVNGGFLNHEFLSCDEINDGTLSNDEFNVIVHGGQQAYYSDLTGDLFNPFTRLSYLKIKRFVKNGGGYVGSCNGAYIAAEGVHRPLQLARDFQYSGIMEKVGMQMGIIDRPVYRALPGGSGGCTHIWGSAGSGITMRLVNTDNPVSFGIPEIIEGLEYVSGPMFLEKKYGTSNTEDIAVIENIGDEDTYCWDAMMMLCPWYKDYIPDVIKQNKIDRWVEYSTGKAVWVTSKYGDGKVVAFGGHPEYHCTRSPPRIAYNAIFYACSKGPFNINIDKSKSVRYRDIACNGPYEAYPLEEIFFKGTLPIINSSNSWVWSYGNGEVGTGQNSSHSYEKYGEYDLILSMCNGSNQLYINFSKVNILGNLNIEPCHYNIKINEPIVFTAKTSGGFKPLSYTWNLGDGNITNLENPTHRYFDEGIYYCNITVEDRLNNQFCRQFTVVVNNESNSYLVNLETDVEEKVNINEAVEFNINITQPGIYEYNLSFDDGLFYEGTINDLSEILTAHNYSQPGVYHPTILVKNDEDKIYISDAQVIVNNPPEKPIIEKKTSEVKIGDRCIFQYVADDPDNDILWYIFEFDGESYGNLTKKFQYKPGDPAILYAIGWFEGEHTLRIKAVDSNDAESDWSDSLNVTVEKGKLWQRPMLRLHRYFKKNPEKFPRLQEFLFQI